MRYTYSADDGQTLEVERPMSCAPELGATLTRDGKTFRRVLDVVQVRREFKPYVSVSMNKYAAGFKHDAKGRPVVESRAQEREYAKRMGYEWL